MLLNLVYFFGPKKVVMEHQHRLSPVMALPGAVDVWPGLFFMISGDIRSHTIPLSAAKDLSKGPSYSVPTAFPATIIGALLTIYSL